MEILIIEQKAYMQNNYFLFLIFFIFSLSSNLDLLYLCVLVYQAFYYIYIWNLNYYSAEIEKFLWYLNVSFIKDNKKRIK